MNDEEDFSDIDVLMTTLPHTDADLDRIIAYQRKMRAQRESGARTKKKTEKAVGKLDVSALLSAPAKPVNRRF